MRLDQALEEKWQWDEGVEARRVFSRLTSLKGPTTPHAAVGVTGLGVVGRTLPDGKRWTHQAEVDVLPSLVGDLVLFTAGGRLIALDLRTGTLRYSVDVGGRRLEGAGSDGQNVVLLLVDKDDARPDQLRALGPHGEDLHSVTTPTRLGTPAAIDGVGLVPYAHQYVGAFELKSGEFIGRLLYRDGVHTVTSDERGALLYGRGVTELSAELANAPDSRSIGLDPRELPGEPSWPVDGSKPRPARANPIALHARVRTDGKLHFAENRYISTYYRIVSAFERNSHELLWTNHLPQSALGARAGEHDTTICLEDGTVVRVSHEDGGVVPFGALEQRLRACVVSASSTAIETPSRPEWKEQIIRTLTRTGTDMAAMQAVLLQELGMSKDAKTTQSLLSLAQNPEVSSELSNQAGRLLESQSQGGQDMVAALREATRAREAQERALSAQAALAAKKAAASTGQSDQTDQTDQTGQTGQTEPGAPELTPTNLRMPPVASIARALIRLKPEGAAEALAPYLEDRTLSADHVAAVMHGVFVLGSEEQRSAVREFLLDYKNTGGEDTLLDALSEAAIFLFRTGSEEQQRQLREELQSQLTHPSLRQRVDQFAAAARGGETPAPGGDGAPEGSPSAQEESPASDGPAE